MALINNDDIMRKCISQRVVKWNSTFDEWKPPSNKQSLGMSQLDSHLHFFTFFSPTMRRPTVSLWSSNDSKIIYCSLCSACHCCCCWTSNDDDSMSDNKSISKSTKRANEHLNLHAAPNWMMKWTVVAERKQMLSCYSFLFRIFC